MRFQCPHCRGIVALDDASGGEAVACGHCGKAVAVPGSRFAPGAVIGEFVLQKTLGEGGMGTVYLAHQVSLDRNAALKILHPRLSVNETYIADFIREARAAAALNHPRIVQAYAVGQDQGVYYFAMEYVEGSTLNQVLTHGGRIVADRALAIADDVASALNFAWANQRLVHGDIKPDNIILTAGGKVKLADLGLARILGDVRKEEHAALFGTPQYISPEQLLGEAGDNRSDIYSLGATLYHALTGHHAYTGTSAADIARKHLTEALPAPRERVPDIPAPVARLIEIMMAKRPEHRYTDAAELMADLARVRRGILPNRHLDPDSQVPIPYGAAATGATTMAAAAGPVAAPIPDTQAIDVSAAAATRARESRPAAKRPKGERGPRRVRRIAVAAVVVMLAAVAVGAALLFRHLGAEQAPRNGAAADPEPGATAPADPEPGEAARDALARLRQAAAAPAPEADTLLREAALFLRRFPDASAARAELGTIMAPFVEDEIQRLRQGRREQEVEAWTQEAERVRSEQATAAEDADRARPEEEQRRRRLKAEEQAAREQRRELQRLAAQRDTLRWQAVETCRKHSYAEADMLFYTMAQGDDSDYSTWARSMRRSLALARRAFELVHNSKTLLAGTKFVVPNKPGRSRIEFIGRRSIDVAFYKYVGGGVGDEVTERVKVPLTAVTDQQMWGLCGLAAPAAERPEETLKLEFAAYLAARASSLPGCRGLLQQLPETPERAFLLAELDALEPLLRGRQWDVLMGRLRAFVEQGAMAAARQFAVGMKAQDPALYSRDEHEIEELLQP